MDWLQKEKTYFLPVFSRFPFSVERGNGLYLYDTEENSYLDFLAGIAVNALGYNHPAILSAVQKQLHRNFHLSNYFIQDIQVELAEKLLRLTPFSKVFFTNSGTEAIEGLLKLVKKWANLNNKSEIVAFKGSFHGRTLGALSITIQEKYQNGFEPLLANIKTVDFNDTEALQQVVSENTAAVIFEGITGEGGIHEVTPEMIRVIKNLRDMFGFLVIQDEIQTGVGRTGRFYHFEYLDFIPDAIASAKGLGGGLPLGAFLVSESLADILKKGEHGTTYGGNPLACAAGLAVIETVSGPDFLKQVVRNGNLLKEMLGRIRDFFPDTVADIRGRGLMLGMEVKEQAKHLMMSAAGEGLLFNIAGGNTLRFVPPLIVEPEHIEEAFDKLKTTFQNVFKH